MSPDELARLPTEQLDALIAAAAHARSQRSDPHAPQAPKEFEATLNPAWFVFLAGTNTIVQFRHAGHGWIAVAIPPPERAHLVSLLMHHALLTPPVIVAQPEAPAAGPAPSAGSGGGTIH